MAQHESTLFPRLTESGAGSEEPKPKLLHYRYFRNLQHSSKKTACAQRELFPDKDRAMPEGRTSPNRDNLDLRAAASGA